MSNESIFLKRDSLLSGIVRFLSIISLDSNEPPFDTALGRLRLGGSDDFFATAFNPDPLSFSSDYGRFFRAGDQCLDDSVDGLDCLASISASQFLANAAGCLYCDGLRYRVSKTI